jgi:hypothetical protein
MSRVQASGRMGGVLTKQDGQRRCWPQAWPRYLLTMDEPLGQQKPLFRASTVVIWALVVGVLSMQRGALCQLRRGDQHREAGPRPQRPESGLYGRTSAPKAWP